MFFESFSSDSKVWIFQSNRNFTYQEIDFIQSELTLFLSHWNAHGKDLLADFLIIENNFIVVAVDETKSLVSGCSIDKLVHQIKKIGIDLKINFFNRLSVLIKKDDELKRIQFSDLKDYEDWSIFNTSITEIIVFRNSFLEPVKSYLQTYSC
jgi:hypothetical protein